MFETGEVERATAAARHRRFFDLRQQASAMFIGLFVGGVIGPVLIAVDHDKGLYRGLFLIVISLVMIAVGAAAWFRLPKDQRTWKAPRPPSSPVSPRRRAGDPP